MKYWKYILSSIGVLIGIFFFQHIFFKNDPVEISSFKHVYQIPVVVHVLIPHDYCVNKKIVDCTISDEDILSQIASLNRDFRRKNPDTIHTPAIFKNIAADTKIQFVLATTDSKGNSSTGIIRKYIYKKELKNDDSTRVFLKYTSYWPSNYYINIYISSAFVDKGNASFPLLKGKQIPGISNEYKDHLLQGVFVCASYFGINSHVGEYASLGRTLTHEMGHYLGLRHIWGDGDCTIDDFVDDTPIHNTPNSSQNISEDCQASIKQKQCSNVIMFQNYMDYTQDHCQNLFTLGQALRMRKILDVAYSHLFLTRQKKISPMADWIYTLEKRQHIPFLENFNNIPTNNIPKKNLWQILNPYPADSNNYMLKFKGYKNHLSTENTNSIKIPIKGNTSRYLLLSFDYAYSKDDDLIYWDGLLVTMTSRKKSYFRNTEYLFHSNLNTTSFYQQDFVPSDTSDFQRVEYLMDTKKLEELDIVFSFLSGGGNNIYLDNIKIIPFVPSIEKSKIAVIYSPKFIYADSSLISFQLHNLSAERIYSIQYHLTNNKKLISSKKYDFMSKSKPNENFPLYLKVPTKLPINNYQLTVTHINNKKLKFPIMEDCISIRPLPKKIIPLEKLFDNPGNWVIGTKSNAKTLKNAMIMQRKKKMIFYFHEYQGARSLSMELLSSLLDMKNKKSAAFRFKLNYTKKKYDTPNGEFRISMSLDYGQSFTEILFKKTLNEIASDHNISENNKKSEWVTIDIGKFLRWKTNILLKFELRSKTNDKLELYDLEIATD